MMNNHSSRSPVHVIDMGRTSLSTNCPLLDSEPQSVERSVDNVRRTGFTLVELLIAMTITLLLMAALAKSFGVIGKSIKEGRSQVSLSSKLRGVSFRLRTDLRSRTADVNPPMATQSGGGYFMYYEGPLTEQTFALFGAQATRKLSDGSTVGEGDSANFFDPTFQKGATYRRYGRIGDFDDYVAFTAEAPNNQWFTGKVPAYLVEDGLTGAAQMEPRVIRSKFAEIIIWATPEWSVDPATNSLNVAPHASGGMPLFRDQNVSNQDLDNDGILESNFVPNRIVLHQRTLLIRPDLNARERIFVGGGREFESDYLRPLNYTPGTAHTANGDTNIGAGYRPTALSNVYPIPGPYRHNQSHTDNRRMLDSNWLTGMAGVHHFFDISMRRIFDPVTGDPTNFVAANSLADLIQPHNRFAHVRYPGQYFGRGVFSTNTDYATSMPLLALGWTDTMLSWQGAADPRAIPGVSTAPAWFPAGHPSPRTLNNASGSTTRTGLFNGWLLPHFELGDANPPGTSQGEHWERGYLTTGNEDRRWDRSGEDVVATNLLEFDVRGFDPTLPVFVTSGPDGEPGRAGVDDDSSGTVDETDLVPFGGTVIPRIELGAAGSDDVLINVSDIGAYDVLGQGIVDPRNPNTFATGGPPPAAIPGLKVALGSRGGFVDLAFPMLAGSPLGNRTAQSLTGTQISSPPDTSATTVTQVQRNFGYFLPTTLSVAPLERPTATTGMNSIKRSGKLVHSANSGAICFFQPAYDTWTDGYESDGFDQTHTQNGMPIGLQMGTTWVLNNVGSSTSPPLPRLPTPASPPLPLHVDTGRYIPTEPETSPPFPTPLQAISLSIRVIDPSSEEIAQFTVVESLQ